MNLKDRVTLITGGNQRIGRSIALAFAKEGAKVVVITARNEERLRETLAESDLVTVHVSFSSTTKNMVGAEQIGLMKRTAYLVNAARGAIVDERALIAPLKERKIAGAALDVFTEEPPAKNSPLLSLDNVVITPHLRGSTLRTRRKSVIVAVNNLVERLKGNSIDSKYVVNPEVYDGGLPPQ